MQLHRHLGALPAAERLRARVVAVGAFDGMHLGHQRVLHRLAERGRDLAAETIVALGVPARGTAALMGTRQRLASLIERGIDRAILVTPDDVVDARRVAAHVGASVLVSGRRLAGNSSCQVDEVDSVQIDGERVDSAKVHAALLAGDLGAARARLGRDPAVHGRIVLGFRRGTPLGIPTANLRVRDLALPPDGVYAVRARLEGRELIGAANIGFNPTFGNRTRSVETHLLDFAGDVYGQRLEIAFVLRLRGEQKFDGLDALLRQIRADIAATRAFFAGRARGG